MRKFLISFAIMVGLGGYAYTADYGYDVQYSTYNNTIASLTVSSGAINKIIWEGLYIDTIAWQQVTAGVNFDIVDTTSSRLDADSITDVSRLARITVATFSANGVSNISWASTADGIVGFQYKPPAPIRLHNNLAIIASNYGVMRARLLWRRAKD